MAISSATSTLYINVIEDVISKVREEFVNNGGPGESVLNELQGIWEMKMMQAGVVCGPIERPAVQKAHTGTTVTPVHDLNVPYEGTDEYETPTADILFPPTPVPTPAPTPIPTPAATPFPQNDWAAGTPTYQLPGTASTPMVQIHFPGRGSDYSTSASDTSNSADGKSGKPGPFNAPTPWKVGPLDVNVAYVEGRDEVDRGNLNQPPIQDFFMAPPGKRKRDDIPSKYQNGGYIPQQDGAGDTIPAMNQGDGSLRRSDWVSTASKEILANRAMASPKISQLDGPIPDPYDEMLSTPNIYNYQGPANEDYNEANTPAPNDLPPVTPVVTQNDTGDVDDEEVLNEDDDEDLDDVDQGEDMDPEHLVLAQFDKVTRTKSRWKCTLKDGIMHINNKDILFSKATGEFDF